MKIWRLSGLVFLLLSTWAYGGEEIALPAFEERDAWEFSAETKEATSSTTDLLNGE